MSYMLLIMESGEARRNRSLEAGHHAMALMTRFGEDLKARGLLKASDSLGSDAKGVRIETRGGKRIVSDGPFTESKEIVGGFFLLDCKTREEALEIAHQCPAAEWATVELRESGPCYDK